jgi:hypothetical protein
MIFFIPGINKISDPSTKLLSTINGAIARSFIAGSIDQLLTANVSTTITNG